MTLIQYLQLDRIDVGCIHLEEEREERVLFFCRGRSLLRKLRFSPGCDMYDYLILLDDANNANVNERGEEESRRRRRRRKSRVVVVVVVVIGRGRSQKNVSGSQPSQMRR